MVCAKQARTVLVFLDRCWVIINALEIGHAATLLNTGHG